MKTSLSTYDAVCVACVVLTGVAVVGAAALGLTAHLTVQAMRRAVRGLS